MDDKPINPAILSSTLKKIDELRLLSPEGHYLRYIIKNFFSNRKQTLQKAEEDRALCFLEKCGAIKIHKRNIEDNRKDYLYELIVIAPRFKELIEKYHHKEFSKVDSSKGDLEFAEIYTITESGEIYRKSGALVCRTGYAGYYLIKTLQARGSAGAKFFKNKHLKWGTIKATKYKIVKQCGEVIQTNASNEYYLPTR